MSPSSSSRRLFLSGLLCAFAVAIALDVAILQPATRSWIGAMLLALWIWFSIIVIPPFLVVRRIVALQATQLTGEERLKAENDIRATVLQTTSTVILILGVVFTFRQLQLGQRQLFANQQSAQRQLNLAEQAQITDRFYRAVGELADKNTDIRIIGLYGLKRVANDSPRDRDTVIAVLSTYIREHAALSYTRDGKLLPLTPVTLPLTNRHPDVQTALTILLEQLPNSPTDVSLQNLDLRGANLSETVLDGIDLSGSILSGADLSWSRFDGKTFAIWDTVDLSNANLHRTKICVCTLRHVNLRGAYLWHARFVGVSLESVDLQDASLHDTRFPGSSGDKETKFPPEHGHLSPGPPNLNGIDVAAWCTSPLSSPSPQPSRR